MVGNQLRGEGAELHRKDGKLISSWKYTANLDDTSVACVVSGEEERSTAIELNIKEDFGQETVTLRNMDDDDKEEYGSEEENDEEDYEEDEEEYDEEYEEEDAATDNSEEADAIENLSASASLAQEDQMSAFEDSVPVARVPDAGLGESEKMGVVSPKMNPSFKSSRFSSSSSSLIPSILSLILALAACLRHY